MILLSLAALLSFSAYAMPEPDIRNNYRKECLEISDFIKSDYSVQCQYNYHHFNATAYKERYDRERAIEQQKVRIAGFNVLHPGMSKTRYKDYDQLARIIDQFDVVGATELLPLVSDDLKNNKLVTRFLKRAPKEILKLREKIKSESDTKKIKELALKLESVESDLSRAKKLYRMPGYLEILHALHRLENGKDWALILSPRGEAARETDVQEMVGFYYRASKVKPKVNQYCRDIRTEGRGYPIACIPLMGADMLGSDRENIFSRRPFMAEFISGRFSFALLSAHVVFTSPREEDKMREILQSSFGVDHYEQLGPGANAANYARFAEVKSTLDFMRELRKKFNQKDIILVGDMNLESDNPFWQHVLPAMPGAKLYVQEKTTLSDRRYESDGTETNGVSSDYDHFIFDQQETNECADAHGKVNAKAWDIFTGMEAGILRRNYRIREERKYAGKYVINRVKYKRAVNRFIKPYKSGEKSFETIGIKTIKVGRKKLKVRGIIQDHDKTAKYIQGFYERVLDSQLEDDSYYRYFSEIISDHKPIYMDCSTH